VVRSVENPSTRHRPSKGSEVDRIEFELVDA
jgi:hypothetical protein